MKDAPTGQRGRLSDTKRVRSILPYSRDERDSGPRHQSYCTHPDSQHGGGCPIQPVDPFDVRYARNVPRSSDDQEAMPLVVESAGWSVEPEPEPERPQSEVQALSFHGREIPILVDERGRWASVTALCRAMGIDGNAQRQLIERKHWSEGQTCMTHVSHSTVPGASRHYFLHEKRVPMWLANIDTSRLRDPEVRARVEATQVEFADVLAEWVSSGQVKPKGTLPSVTSTEMLTPRDWARMVLQEADRADAAEARQAIADDKMRAIEGGDGITLTKFHKKYFSDIHERPFFEHLYSRKWIIDQRKRDAQGEPLRSGQGRPVYGPEHRDPAAKGKSYLYLHTSLSRDGQRRESTHVRPGYETALRDALAAEGLSPNEGPLAIEGGDWS